MPKCEDGTGSEPVSGQVLRSDTCGTFTRTLHEEHQIELSYTWVKQALQAAGMVKRKAKRGVHRKRRERRPICQG